MESEADVRSYLHGGVLGGMVVWEQKSIPVVPRFTKIYFAIATKIRKFKS